MIVALIPARGGSQRVPGKNKRMFFGKPIIVYSIETAKATGLFDQIIVTTDDREIADIAYGAGAWAVYRPKHLCDNEVGTQEVISSHAGHMPSSMVCGIYATSPLMLADDIRRAHRALVDHNNFHYAMAVGTEPLRDAGQFYFGRTEAFLKRKPLLTMHTAMIPIETKRVCDINTEEDWQRAESMYKELHP